MRSRSSNPLSVASTNNAYRRGYRDGLRVRRRRPVMCLAIPESGKAEAETGRLEPK